MKKIFGIALIILLVGGSSLTALSELPVDPEKKAVCDTARSECLEGVNDETGYYASIRPIEAVPVDKRDPEEDRTRGIFECNEGYSTCVGPLIDELIKNVGRFADVIVNACNSNNSNSCSRLCIFSPGYPPEKPGECKWRSEKNDCVCTPIGFSPSPI